MSAFTIFTAGVACLASFVSAYHAPIGDAPVGNPILLPGLGSVVPVGQDYTVKWTPTTNGTVSLILLKGPANNLAVVGPIAESIDNSGSYTWKPSTDLTSGPTDTTGYGIELVVDSTGQYQYSTQFGISNPQGGDHSVSSSYDSSWTSTSCAPSATSPAASDAQSYYQSSSDAASMTTSVSMITSWSNMTSTVPITTASGTSAPVTLATSTVSVQVASSSSTPSSTTSAPALSSTGGAATLKSGVMGLLGVAAVAVLAL